MQPLLQKFDKMIVWKQAGTKRIPEPVHGLDGAFDDANSAVTDCHKAITNYVEHVKKELKIHPKDAEALNLVSTSSRLRFELEVKDSELIKSINDG